MNRFLIFHCLVAFRSSMTGNDSVVNVIAPIRTGIFFRCELFDDKWRNLLSEFIFRRSFSPQAKEISGMEVFFKTSKTRKFSAAQDLIRKLLQRNSPRPFAKLPFASLAFPSHAQFSCFHFRRQKFYFKPFFAIELWLESLEWNLISNNGE